MRDTRLRDLNTSPSPPFHQRHFNFVMKERNPSDSSRDNRKPVVLRRADWASHDEFWKTLNVWAAERDWRIR